MTALLAATAVDPGDPGHLVPDDVWALIVAGATERAERLELPTHGLATVDRTITARSHGGAMAGGPRLGVIHSGETPLAAGYAYSIAANWFATKATTSATVMIDPAETIRLLPDDVVAYHCGPAGNGFTVGVEQAGYARLTRAEWLTVAGWAQLRRVAEYMVECWLRWGIPLRWATDAQVRAAAAGGAPQGWCYHDDVRRVLGGTVHTDPVPNYPGHDLMALAQSLAAPAPTPAPRRPSLEDHVYISCAARPFTGLLTGGVLHQLTSRGEFDSMELNIKNGAPRQWVESATLDRMLAASVALTSR